MNIRYFVYVSKLDSDSDLDWGDDEEVDVNVDEVPYDQKGSEAW